MKAIFRRLISAVKILILKGMFKMKKFIKEFREFISIV